MKKYFTFFLTLLLILLFSAACASIRTITPTPIPTSPHTATLQITQTSTSTPVVYPVIGYDVLLSPNGTKKAVYDSSSGRTFEVTDKNGTVLWSITYDVNKFKDDFGMLAEAWYKPFYWSKDENYLYYTCFHGGEIDGSGKYYGNEFIDGCGVFRLDIKTGETIEILPEIAPMYGYYAFSISPDERYLVYTYQAETPVKIKLLNLKTKVEQLLLTADDDVLETGNYGWSPQGNSLVFMTLKIVDKKRFYSIFTLDLNSLETKLMIENFDTHMRFVSWNDEGIISYVPGNAGGVLWQIRTDSKMFSIVTITPSAEFISTPTP